MKFISLISFLFLSAAQAAPEKNTQIAVTTAAKTASIPPKILASLKIEDGNTQYKIIDSHSEKEAIFERQSSKLTNKTIKIPKGLALAIKADLLSLSWQAQYKSVRPGSASTCDLVARIDVEAEDSVKICEDQREVAVKIQTIQKRLNDLITSRK